jgi:hypothetical protein
MGEAMMEKKGESWPAAGSSSDFQSFLIEIEMLVRAFYARGRVRVCRCARLGRILAGRGQVVTGKKYG